MNFETDGIDIQPGVNSYGLFANYNYKPWTALGELVDNSISSWTSNRVALEKMHGEDFVLKISIEFDELDGGRLSIVDNAGGINAQEYQRAFRLGAPPTDLHHLSQFGVGMKAAACWFAKKWIVESTAISEDVVRTLEWDTAKIMRENAKTLLPTTSRARPDDHFTKIELWDLNHSPKGGKTIGKILSHLTKMYRRFLSEGHVEIFWRGQKLKVKEEPILVAPYFSQLEQPPIRWDLPLSFVLESGQAVTGRAYLLETMEKPATALNIFWRNRLIKGNFEPNYRPPELFGAPSSFRTGRLCIDVLLDSFRPTSDKQGINFEADGATEEEFLDELKVQLNLSMPLLKQAEGYRDKVFSTSFIDACEKELTLTVQDLHNRAATIMLPTPRIGATYEYPPTSLEPDQQRTTSSTVCLKVDGNPWEITIEFRNGGRSGEWLSILEQPKLAPSPMSVTKMLVALELDHPFNKQFLTDETAAVIVRFAAGFAFSELKATRVGYPDHPVVIRKTLSRFLCDVLSTPVI